LFEKEIISVVSTGSLCRKSAEKEYQLTFDNVSRREGDIPAHPMTMKYLCHQLQY